MGITEEDAMRGILRGWTTAALAVGVIVGAQIGAIISSKLHGAVIVRFMAIALLALGSRLLISTLY